MNDKKAELYVPIENWSEIMVHVDQKIQVICNNYGYGSVKVEFVIHRGKIIDVIFADEIRVRDLVKENKSVDKQ